MTKRNIVHVEIPAADVEKTGEFYKSLFDWDIQPIPDMNYTMWDAGEGSVGGFPEVSKDIPAGKVIIYINSEDIEADLKKAESLGGTTVFPKTEIPEMGWYGMFNDPTGNTIALYTSMNPESNY